MENNLLPLGFGMALAQNEAAMKRFESLTEPEKLSVIERTRQVRSREEMLRLVSGLTDRKEENKWQKKE